MAAQLELFEVRRRPDVVRQCPQCGGFIVTYHQWPDGKGHDAGFIGDDGRCYDCTYPRKAKPGKRLAPRP